ncbi:protein-S-isoprenylcysteine O-methyltransferase-like [Oppia nitens]|uniref:protein-S-isoprenylcysteine O-methyltransferase-like n=1 Tax=Oppia nitens TaxID=1686743 RepID=UPI0023DCB806|nr:protein-S-isoprenylcysteine O-methyltransferase-like [Oppia nitens]
MVCLSGRIALASFVSSLTSLPLIAVIKHFVTFGDHIITEWFGVIFVSHALTTHAILGYRYYRRSKQLFDVSIRAGLLGEGLALGLWMALLATTNWSSIFGLYLSVLSLFHFSEYIMTAIINPNSLSLDSFLLNHSKEYGIAAAASVTEFIIETYFWPQIKLVSIITNFGVFLCLSGELMRKLAMITAGSNFNHIVQNRHKSGHVLVTNGIYSLCRHPSYVGWFCWSIGTQLILLNPICLVGYAMVSWKFFKERIYEEEITLIHFFGRDYIKYKQKVFSGLPFIYGCQLKD